MNTQNPYLVITFFGIIILGLFGVRYVIAKVRKAPEVMIGNAQTMGSRGEQEDSFATIVNDHGVLAVLADGMGGYSKGKMASSLSVSTFSREFAKTATIEPTEVFFRDTAYICNKKVLEKAKGVKTGSTLVAVVISEGYLYWVSVGDSAIALFRNGEFINLNRKQIFQSFLEQQYLSRQISKEELLNNPKKKRLTNYIGYEGFKEIIINNRSLQLRHGDKVILCSDGVYNSISEMEIEQVLSKNISPYKAAEEIVEIIHNKKIPNQDNATIIILEKNNSD